MVLRQTAATVVLALAHLGVLAWSGAIVAGERVGACGGESQCSCNITQAVPGCDPWLSASGAACGILGLQRTCVAAPCGAQDQRGCEPFVDHGYADTCRPGLFAQLGLGKAVDEGAFPADCGGRGQPACTLDQQVARTVTACKPGLDELYLPLGSCYPAEDLRRRSPRPWPADEAAPGRRSVFLVHGMTGGLASFSPSGDALAPALKARGHRVFAVDYNADGEVPRALSLYELLGGRWQFAGVHGRPLAGTTLSLTDVADSLKTAILATRGVADVAIVGHSMGGLVARTLVQKHYDELRLAGRRVADVVTLGSPHTGGGLGIPEITVGRGVQDVTMCWGLRAIGDPPLRRVSYQACTMDRWHQQREKLPPGQHIDDRDFPQVRWVTVAGGGQIVLDQSVNAAYEQIQRWLNANFALGLDSVIAEVDSDSMVAVSSAFGIQVDSCFPHRHDEPDAALPALVPDGAADGARLRRTIRAVNGHPLHSAQCFMPSHAPATDDRYPHPERLDDTDHQYERRREVIAFVAAMLSPAEPAPGAKKRRSADHR
jgi:pimeloyl-ACP methyl ester carboxylesterase